MLPETAEFVSFASFPFRISYAKMWFDHMWPANLYFLLENDLDMKHLSVYSCSWCLETGHPDVGAGREG